MSRVVPNSFHLGRIHFPAGMGWVLWSMFLALWAASLVPFYANGLHLVSDISLEYAGGGYARFNIPYAPLPEAVYGTSLFSSFARTIVCFGPCMYVLVAGVGLWILLTSRRSLSRVA